MDVYEGRTPDVVPCMLDLSHWFDHLRQRPYDMRVPAVDPDHDLIDYHKRAGVGYYMPNRPAFYSASYPRDARVVTDMRTRNGSPEIVWRIETPVGAIERARAWESQTYAWGISQWGIRDEADLRVFQYAMSRGEYTPHWDRYRQWDEAVGDCGVVYLSPGYSAIGHLLNYWMGVEALVYATMDFPAALRETVDSVNGSFLRLVDLICESSARIVLMGDNFSSDVQSPAFFHEWSRAYYVEAIARLHRAGKYVAVHIDGKLRGALRMMSEAGADCADAVTPTPMGDLSAEQCRAEAGKDLILSGGVSPDLWLPNVPIEAFEGKVLEWVEQRNTSPRLIANAGDQVPPGAEERRITIMRDLVEEYGRF